MKLRLQAAPARRGAVLITALKTWTNQHKPATD